MEMLGMTGPPRVGTAVDPSLLRFDQNRLSRRLTNLPAQLTSFVGRAVERADLEVLVRARRLVTVTGPAGVGKTRLALQVAADLAEDLPDGVWLVELAPVDDPDLIALMMLEAMGVNRGRCPRGRVPVRSSR
jgi:ATP/maltotriose-dependent transcriptional regulator MalT